MFTRPHRRRIALVAALVGSLATLIGPTTAQAQTIAQTKAEIAALSAQLNAETQQSERSANAYDADQAVLSHDNAVVYGLQTKIAAARQRITATSSVLATDVVRAYVSGESAAQIEALFNQNVDASDARALYAALAVGNLDAVKAQLLAERHALGLTLNQVAAARNQAANQTNRMHALLVSQEALQSQTQATLNTVTAHLRTQIINYEIAAGAAAARSRNTYAEEQAVNAASQVGGQAAANLVIEAIRANTPPVVITGPAGSAEGDRAVSAAVSQIGVPYVWGGETPGQGFDCSGLVQWAWAQAGVSIPRTTEQQWAQLPHVSLHDLQPGDLIYYFNLDGDNAVDHVVMYTGSGPWGSSTIVQAAHTGTNIAYSPLFTYGLIGAVRP